MSDINAFDGNVGNPRRDTRRDQDESDESPSGRGDSASDVGADIEKRSGKTSEKSKEAKDSSSREAGADTSGSGRDRKRRITVTPRDYEELEDTADELGTSKAGVYNRAFQRLKQQSDHVTVTPQDPGELEAAAEALGLSKEGVYRFALRRLLDDGALEIDV